MTIQEILLQIDQLPEDERLLLEQRLTERAEAEWRQEAVNARQLAHERGIDQATIDQAIHRVRYGQ
jgi:hypothetical protein